MLHLLKVQTDFQSLPLTKAEIFDSSPQRIGGGRILTKLILALSFLVSCSFIFATAAEIRDGVLSNMPAFDILRDPNSTHGNQYAFGNIAIIDADYDLPTVDFSLFPELPCAN